MKNLLIKKDKSHFLLIVIFLSSSLWMNINCCAQTTYYISNKGSDLNSGLSPEFPWKTIKEKINGAIYLFKSGEVFNIKISGFQQHSLKKTTFSKYGKGAQPILSSYFRVSLNSFIKTEFNNVWYYKFSDVEKKSFVGIANIGFAKYKNSIYGRKLDAVEKLNKAFDFCSTNEGVFVFISQGLNYSEYFDFSPDGIQIELFDNIEIINLTIIGVGGHAVKGINVKNVKLKNLHISEIGGSYLIGYKDNKTRYGNGIEFWNGADSCIVTNTKIVNVYDSGITLQGIGANINFSNIKISSNKIDSCEQSFEFWVSGDASGFQKVTFSKNDCRNAGYSWGHEYRPDLNVGVHLLNYFYDCKYTDLRISKNRFENWRNGYIYFTKLNFQKCHFSITNNTLRNNNKSNYLIYHSGDISEFKKVNTLGIE